MAERVTRRSFIDVVASAMRTHDRRAGAALDTILYEGPS